MSAVFFLWEADSSGDSFEKSIAQRVALPQYRANPTLEIR
jgi:hypothetical protein